MDFIQKGFTGKNDSWRYILTMVLVFIGIQIASIPLIIAAFFQVDGDLEKFQKGAESSFMDIGMNSSLFLFLMIFTFMIGILTLFLCVKYLHKKKFIAIITSREKIDWNRVFYAFALWGSVSVVAIFIGMYLGSFFFSAHVFSSGPINRNNSWDIPELPDLFHCNDLINLFRPIAHVRFSAQTNRNRF